MIVPMNRIILAARRSDEDEILDQLFRAGVVELVEAQPEENDVFFAETDEDELKKLERDIDLLKNAIEVLKPYHKESLLSAKPEVTLDTLISAGAEGEILAEVAEHIYEAGKLKERLLTERGRIGTVSASLMPWRTLDHIISEDIPQGVKHFELMHGMLPSYASVQALESLLDSTELPYEIEEISADKSARYMVIYGYKGDADVLLAAARTAGFSRLQFHDTELAPAEELKNLAAEIESIDDRISELDHAVIAKAPLMPNFKLCCDGMCARYDRVKAKSSVLRSENAIYLSGWVPKETVGELMEKLLRFECAFDFLEPDEEEDFPVLIKNSHMVEPMQVVTELYSLPNPHGIDPNPLMAPFYILFFGMMLADAGYGILIMALLAFAIRKMKPIGSMNRMLRLIFWGCASSAFWGAVFGSWFGDFPTVFASTFLSVEFSIPPLWVSPLEDPMSVMLLSFALGALHIFTGMGIKAYMLIKRRQFMEAFTSVFCWYFIFAGIGLGVVFGPYGFILTGVGVLGIVLFKARDKKNPVMRLGSGLLGLYDITSFVSDVLSYSRILALGLSSGVVASVMNILATIAGGGVIGFMIMIPVFVIGHTFNIAVNLLGCFVHTSRLQFVEFFNKFYESGGKPFTPLGARPKYVTVAPPKKRRAA